MKKFTALTLSLTIGAHALAMGSKAPDNPTPTEVPLPRSVSTMGDSMTAAFIAHLNRSDFILPWASVIILWQIVDYYAHGKNYLTFERKESLSWATGQGNSKVFSQAGRIQYLLGRRTPLEVMNAAVTGAASKDLEAQVNHIIKWSHDELGTRAPEYVSLLIGANDVCGNTPADMTSVATYRQRVSAATDRLLARSPKTKILVSALPNIENLRSVARRARLMLTPPFMYCEDIWKFAKVCPTLTTISNPSDRAKVAQRIRDYNRALQTIVTEQRRDYGDRIRYAAKPYDVQFTPNHLSADCFHPNKAGQALLADATWDSSWWAESNNRVPARAAGWQIESENEEDGE